VRLQNCRGKKDVRRSKITGTIYKNKDKASSSTSQSQTKESNKPPPIMITGIKNHENLTSIIKQAIGDENYQTKLMNNGITKVNVSSDHAYRILTNSLKANHTSWFSYENKQNRDIKS
jgi:hypothetical protein